MPVYSAPRRDLAFVLFDLFGADKLWRAMKATAEVDRDLAEAIIDAGGKLAESAFLPLNASGDAEGCRFDSGTVTTPEGFRDAYRTYSEGGWVGLGGDPEHGGQGMPKMLTVAVEEMFFATNPSLYLYPVLSAGAALLIASHGSQAMKKRWLPEMYAGTTSGTMCLTEPHAGSDLGLLRTRAEPLDNEYHALTGTKIFITGGEHDLADNIVHLVLARLPDAPEGSKGISLFLVPKFLEDGTRNVVTAGSIEHKMGIRGSATCVLNFDGARAWMIGEPNRGLACMFTMMNYERLSIGMQGLGAGEIAYQNALAYARERVQGRAPIAEERGEGAADPLLVHPDVRRLLLTQKAYNEGGRAFSAFVGLQLDLSKYADDENEARRAADLVAFLTPVAKAYFTDRGFDGCVLAQQVLGGHGYVAEWGIEQYVRDARIAQIYEGTNGIQAMDLAERKTARDGGRMAQAYMEGMAAFIADQRCPERLRPGLEEALELFSRCTRFIVDGAKKDPALPGSAAADYLELTGLVSYAWLWAWMVGVAEGKLAEGSDEDAFMRGKVATGEFFHARLLPMAATLARRIESGSEPLLAIRAEQF